MVVKLLGTHLEDWMDGMSCSCLTSLSVPLFFSRSFRAEIEYMLLICCVFRLFFSIRYPSSGIRNQLWSDLGNLQLVFLALLCVAM